MRRSAVAPRTGAHDISPEAGTVVLVVRYRMLWVMAVAAATLVFAAPASAQDSPEPAPVAVTEVDDAEAAQPESGVVRDEDTSATVRRIRRDLIIVAGVTSVALAVYVWHTSPTRRVRVAARRANAVLENDAPADG